MGYLPSANTITLTTSLTKRGKELILNSDDVNVSSIKYFSLGDSDVNYELGSYFDFSSQEYLKNGNGFIPNITGIVDNCVTSLSKNINRDYLRSDLISQRNQEPVTGSEIRFFNSQWGDKYSDGVSELFVTVNLHVIKEWMLYNSGNIDSSHIYLDSNLSQSLSDSFDPNLDEVPKTIFESVQNVDYTEDAVGNKTINNIYDGFSEIEDLDNLYGVDDYKLFRIVTGDEANDNLNHKNSVINFQFSNLDNAKAYVFLGHRTHLLSVLNRDNNITSFIQRENFSLTNPNVLVDPVIGLPDFVNQNPITYYKYKQNMILNLINGLPVSKKPQNFYLKQYNKQFYLNEVQEIENKLLGSTLFTFENNEYLSQYYTFKIKSSINNNFTNFKIRFKYVTGDVDLLNENFITYDNLSI